MHYGISGSKAHDSEVKRIALRDLASSRRKLPHSIRTLATDMSAKRSWLCENGRRLGDERTNYSLKTVFAIKCASASNLENALKNVILAEFRSFAFLHSQGQSRRFNAALAISDLALTADM
jgi:hypothetical protein